jgi:hypothetical protein
MKEIIRKLVYNIVLKFRKAYIKGCVLAATKGTHCLSLITDLKLINCVETSDLRLEICSFYSEGLLS